MKVVIVLSLLLATGVVCMGQSGRVQAVTPSPTPSPTATPPKFALVTEQPTVESAPRAVYKMVALPTPTPAQSSSKFEYGGSIQVLSRYHALNGVSYREGHDQHIDLYAAYNFSEDFQTYAGAWGSVQTQEVNPYIGFAYKQLDVFYQLYTYEDTRERYLQHSLNAQVTQPLTETDQFKADAFGRIEWYKTNSEDQLQGGVNLFGGFETETILPRQLVLRVKPYLVWDSGVLDEGRGSLMFVEGDLLRKIGRVHMGPGFLWSFPITADRRENLFTVRWTISF